jgi:putative ABC transport system substrate-binding protein
VRLRHVRRAGTVGLLALGVLAAAVGVGAQPAGKVWRIGLFHVSLDHVPPSLEPLRAGLKALGYREGRNLQLDWRNLPDEEAARATAREFVKARVDLIVAFENQTARAAKAATTEIPIVFVHVTDAVADGFVKSLAHPGGNLTGFAGFVLDFPEKSLELFKEAVPRLHRVLVLSDPQDPVSPRMLAEIRKAASALKLEVLERIVHDQPDVERVFGSLSRSAVDGVFVASPNLHVKFTSLLIKLATDKRLPLPSFRKEWVEQGALLSYAPDLAEVGRASAYYVDRILKGTRPADLPVERPAKFELVVNLKVAKALGLTIPKSVLVRADALIQ